jgi:hypothetical protein
MTRRVWVVEHQNLRGEWIPLESRTSCAGGKNRLDEYRKAHEFDGDFRLTAYEPAKQKRGRKGRRR